MASIGCAKVATKEKRMNSLVREALEIAISNWEFDGEYDKVSEAVTLIKEEASE